MSPDPLELYGSFGGIAVYRSTENLLNENKLSKRLYLIHLCVIPGDPFISLHCMCAAAAMHTVLY